MFVTTNLPCPSAPLRPREDAELVQLDRQRGFGGHRTGRRHADRHGNNDDYPRRTQWELSHDADPLLGSECRVDLGRRGNRAIGDLTSTAFGVSPLAAQRNRSRSRGMTRSRALPSPAGHRRHGRSRPERRSPSPGRAPPRRRSRRRWRSRVVVSSRPPASVVPRRCAGADDAGDSEGDVRRPLAPGSAERVADDHARRRRRQLTGAVPARPSAPRRPGRAVAATTVSCAPARSTRRPRRRRRRSRAGLRDHERRPGPPYRRRTREGSPRAGAGSPSSPRELERARRRLDLVEADDPAPRPWRPPSGRRRRRRPPRGRRCARRRHGAGVQGRRSPRARAIRRAGSR